MYITMEPLVFSEGIATKMLEILSNLLYIKISIQ